MSTTDARKAILQALRRVSEPSARYRAATYRHAGELRGEARTRLFVERVSEYGAAVHRVTPEGLGTTLSELIGRGQFHSLAVPSGLPPAWVAELNGIERMPESTTTDAELAQVDAVLTASTAAVSISGSIVLQHGPAEGRRALSLLPDHHFCVVAEETIYETLHGALDALKPAEPTTIISGPSATADIEMTRIQGVHGPRNLTVLLVSRSPAHASAAEPCLPR